MARRAKGKSRALAVYHWEDKFAGSMMKTYVQSDAARGMLRTAARMYGVPIPALRVVRQKRSEIAWASTDGSITVNLWYKTASAMLLAHEMAHVITWAMGFEEDGLGHGPIWLGVYIWLMSAFKILPSDLVMQSLKEHGIEFEHPYWCSPDNIWELEDDYYEPT